jgi:hypothetical protein
MRSECWSLGGRTRDFQLTPKLPKSLPYPLRSVSEVELVLYDESSFSAFSAAFFSFSRNRFSSSFLSSSAGVLARRCFSLLDFAALLMALPLLVLLVFSSASLRYLYKVAAGMEIRSSKDSRSSAADSGMKSWSRRFRPASVESFGLPFLSRNIYRM